MALEVPGSQNVWAVVHGEEERRMIRTGQESDELSYDQTPLRGVAAPVRSTHLFERTANHRMDPQTTVYADSQKPEYAYSQRDDRYLWRYRVRGPSMER
jgi:hypothetical protein